MSSDQSNQDLQLKLMCKILFKEMGYVTHYEIKLRTKSYIQQMKIHDTSDIDVYGCNFLSDMTFTDLGSECKSGETKALDELYKLIGVVNYCDLDKGYFIKTKIHQNARQVATKKKISCFSEVELRQLLLGLNVDVDKQLKIENAKYSKLSQAINLYKKDNEKLVDYITYDYWNKENWRSIHNLIFLFQKETQLELFPETSIFKILFYYYLLELFSLSMLRNISEAMLISYSDIQSALKVTLYGGEESLIERQKIFDLVNLATNENKPLSPEWEIDFISLSSRFASHTKDSGQIIHLLQDIRENAFYSKQIKIQASILNKYSDLTRKFTQDVVHFLSKYAGVNLKIFEELMSL